MAGSIINKGKNVHLVRLFIGYEGGKRKYHSKTIHGNKKAAERYLNKILREKDLGELMALSEEVLSIYLDKWLETSAKGRLASSTFKSYSNYINIYIKPNLGDRVLSKISTMEIQSFYNGLIAKGLSPKTVKNIHSVLRSSLNQAIIWKLLRVNPAKLVDLPKIERKEMKVLTPNQAALLMKHSVNSPWKALFSLLLSTGMRPGEALGLRWSDIDFSKKRLYVQKSLSKVGTEWRLTEPKTSRSRRSIPLPPTVIKDLEEHRINYVRIKLSTTDYNDYDLVFAGEKGDPVDENNINRRHFKNLLKSAGLQDMRLYDLRHSCATLLLAAGENPKVVSERLGHASITTTLDVYSHVLPDMQDKATSKMETILFQEPQTETENNSHTICTPAK